MTVSDHLSTSAAPDTARPAEVDRRFLALVVDRLVGWGLVAGIGYASWRFLVAEDMALVGWSVAVLGALLVGLAFAVMTGLRGVTPGKALLGLRVVEEGTGRPIGVGAAVLRGLIVLAGTVPLGFGLVMIAWSTVTDPSRQRRGFHDTIVGSVVLDVRPEPVDVAEEVDSGPRHVVNLTAMRLRPVTTQPVTPPARRPAQEPPRATQRPEERGPEQRPEQRRPERQPEEQRFVRQPQEQPPRPPQGQPPRQPQHQPQRQPQRPPAPQQPPGAPLRQTPPRPPQQTPPQSPPPVETGRRRREEPTGERRPQPPQRPQQPQRPPQAPQQTRSAPPADSTRAVRTTSVWRVTFDHGESFVVTGLGLVGRKPEARPGEEVAHLVPLRSNDMSVSKTHAQFHLSSEGALVVMDRGSTNGSFIHRGGMGRELTAGRPATLLDGDLVRFGDREMRVSREG